jgi:hypothetical protein
MLLSLSKFCVNGIYGRREGSGGRGVTADGKCGEGRTTACLSLFSAWKVKGRFVPIHAKKPFMGSGGIAPVVLNPALYGGE